MGSPSPYTPDEVLTPMQIDALQTRSTLTGQRLAQLWDMDSPEHGSAPPGRGLNTARRSRPGPSRGRGRG
jgi:hypothetical protein